MSYLRIHHLFFALMGLAAVVAFLVPPRFVARFEPQVQVLFAPVSRPVGGIAAWVTHRVAPPAADDARAAEDIRQDNKQLRAELAWLQLQLEDASRRDTELAKLGPLKDRCQIFKVVGGDSGTRESLAISGSTLEGVRDEMYVLYLGGLVGKIQRAGVGGSQVQLMSDPAFRVRVRFARYIAAKSTFEYMGTPAVLAEGAGGGMLVVRGLTLADVGLGPDGKRGPEAGGLHEDTDYAVLFDPYCPRELQGETIGKVIRVAQRPDARLFAEVRIQPNTNLKRLREVMVMTKEQ